MFSVVSVKVHQGTFAFRLEDVLEVLLLPSLRPHSENPSIIEGWFQLREQPVPVLSLARVLGQADPPPQISDHLVLSRGHPVVAWRVQGVKGVTAIEGQDLEMARRAPDSPRVFLARYRKDGEDAFLLNAGELLSEAEAEYLKTSRNAVIFG